MISVSEAEAAGWARAAGASNSRLHASRMLAFVQRASAGGWSVHRSTT
jgi:hypothetical protein